MESLPNFTGNNEYIRIVPTAENDYLNLSSFDNNYLAVDWSPGNDTVVGSLSKNFNLYFNFHQYYWKLLEDPSYESRVLDGTGVTVDNSSGTIVFNSEFGTSTIIGANDIGGTHLNDVFIGSSEDEKFHPNGGTDIVTGGAGQDRFHGIFGLEGVAGQTKLTITDYENYEGIEFEDAIWDENGSYGFTKSNIESQLSVRYDEGSQQTLLSINTDLVNREDFVVLSNGQFELSTLF